MAAVSEDYTTRSYHFQRLVGLLNSLATGDAPVIRVPFLLKVPGKDYAFCCFYSGAGISIRAN